MARNCIFYRPTKTRHKVTVAMCMVTNTHGFEISNDSMMWLLRWQHTRNGAKPISAQPSSNSTNLIRSGVAITGEIWWPKRKTCHSQLLQNCVTVGDFVQMVMWRYVVTIEDALKAVRARLTLKNWNNAMANMRLISFICAFGLMMRILFSPFINF